MKIKYIAVVFGIFGIIAVYANELVQFSNTFESEKMVGYSLALGALLGGALGFWWSKSVEEVEDKIQIYAACIICLALFMPLAASLTNRIFAQPIENKYFKFVQRIPYSANRFGITKQLAQSVVQADGYFLYAEYKNNKVERLKVKHPMFEEITRGDMILLPVRTGLLGFDFFVDL